MGGGEGGNQGFSCAYGVRRVGMVSVMERCGLSGGRVSNWLRGVGRVSERSWYILGATNARANASHIGGYAVGADGRLIESGDGDFVRLPADLRDEIDELRWERF